MEDFTGASWLVKACEALREAQLAMEGKYPDPFFWGAFICRETRDSLQRKETG